MMRIYIPTMGRKNQVTYSQLPLALQKVTTLVVPQDELASWRGSGIDVVAHPRSCKSIGPVRQFICAELHNVSKYGAKLIMLDDDIRFSARRTDDPTKFCPTRDEDIILGFKMVEDLVGSYGHAAIRHREMANESPVVEYAARALRALAYDVRLLKKVGARFDRIIVMEDFDVTLQLLEAGYANAIYSGIIQNQNGSGAAGGCSTYRTMEKQAEGAHGLARLHPGFVKVVEKTTKGAWGGGTRTDVQVAWKKAAKAGGATWPT